MMYFNKLAVAIKHKGKVLREFGETVYIPFGSHYSIFVKNLNTVRALVSISIDGTDIGDGTQFIIEPNDSIDIERFIKNGNLKQGNRFKFIERTSNIEKHRGINTEDGIVRIEYKFEKPEQISENNDILNKLLEELKKNKEKVVYPPYIPPSTYPPTVPRHPWESPWVWYSSNVSIGGYSEPTFSNLISNNDQITSCNYSEAKSSLTTNNSNLQTQNENGFTVEGEISQQQFKTGDWFKTEDQSHVIVLTLRGETADNRSLRKPVTVKTKAKCKTCGRMNKVTAKFCSECGTSLTIV